MEPSNSHEAIWLARGTALGIFLRRLLQALRAGAGRLDDVGRARRGLPKMPYTKLTKFEPWLARIILFLGRAGASQSRAR
jgi:hypothetical protein